MDFVLLASGMLTQPIESRCPVTYLRR